MKNGLCDQGQTHMILVRTRVFVAFVLALLLHSQAFLKYQIVMTLPNELQVVEA